MKIKVHPDISKKIAKEFGVSGQTVQTALSYFNNSATAQNIRKRIKEELIKEANKIVIKPAPEK